MFMYAADDWHHKKVARGFVSQSVQKHPAPLPLKKKPKPNPPLKKQRYACNFCVCVCVPSPYIVAFPLGCATRQAFSDYQMQQMTSHFIDQFGFSEEDFTKQEDNVK